MTEKQKRFAEEYLIDLNATRAYKAAYPSVKRDETAAAAATRLLKNVKVQAYIRERMEARQERVQLSQDDVIGKIREIAFADASPDAKMEQVRLRALELLGKHLGMFSPFKDDLDRKEQQARIDKLQSETRRPEDKGGEIEVRFVGTEGAEI